MADRLVVFERRDLYRIGYYLEDEEDIGAVLGEDLNIDIPEQDPGLDWGLNSDWDYKIAVKTILSLPDIEKDNQGFYWETRNQAQKILKLIKIALKNYQDSKKDLPDWAKKAIAAGWKPPKGWKP